MTSPAICVRNQINFIMIRQLFMKAKIKQMLELRFNGKSTHKDSARVPKKFNLNEHINDVVLFSNFGHLFKNRCVI